MFTILQNVLAWCEQNGFDISVVLSEDDEFYYCQDEATIYWGKSLNERMEKIWINFVTKLGFKYVKEIPIEFQAFFHELGHHMTIGYITDEEWALYDMFGMYWNSSKITDEMQLAYYNLTVEKEATLWAIEYMNNNYEKIMSLVKDCGFN